MPGLSISEATLYKEKHQRESADVETSSEDYASRFSGRIGAFFLQVQTEITLDLLKDSSSARILDIGGGHAQAAVPLVRSGFNVTVIGSSEACKRRLDRFLEPDTFRFQSCDMLSLPFYDRSFDVVLAYRLLPHVTQWKKLLAEMCRVSSKDVIVDYPDIISLNILSRTLFKAKKALEGNTRPFRCFLRKELLEEFGEHGFLQSAIRTEFMIPMVIHRTLGQVEISKALEFLFRISGMTRLFGSPVILRVSRSD